MRLLSAVLITFLLSGCFGPKTFNASSEEAMKASVTAIMDELPKDKHEQFQSALMYFSLGRDVAEKGLFGNLPTSDAAFLANVQVLDGLTGDEILTKYDEYRAQDRKRREERERVSALQDDAEAYLESNEFEKALEAYRSMAKLPSGQDQAEAGLREAKQQMEAFAEEMAYIDQIEVTEFIAKRIDTYTDQGIPAVRIGLKNHGDRSLDKVKVVVYFQNASGDTIYEEDFYPVLVSRFSIQNNKPLKPGYVMEMEQGRYFTTDSSLTAWKEGAVTMKITDIEFSSR